MFEILERIKKRIDEIRDEELEKMGDDKRKEIEEEEGEIKKILGKEDIKREKELLEMLISKATEESRTIYLKGTGGGLQINLDFYAIYSYDPEDRETGMADLADGIKKAMASALTNEIAVSVLSESINEPTKIDIDIERL